MIDRWGKYRDRFKWDDPYDMKRFVEVAKDVLSEQEPPLEKSFRTRNVLAGIDKKIDTVKWVQEFWLTDQDKKKFYSRDLTGQVWICSFFFSTCPGICVEQNEYISGLQNRLKDHPAKLVSITTDPSNDTPSKLKAYANKIGADLENWKFLSGSDAWTRRISEEYFRAYNSGGHHSSQLYVVDKWGNIRGDFDWRDPNGEIKMLDLIDELNSETRPPAKYEWVSHKKPSQSGTSKGH